MFNIKKGDVEETSRRPTVADDQVAACRLLLLDQQEFDAMLAEAQLKQALAQQLRDEVAEPLREALQALEALQAQSRFDGAQLATLSRVQQRLAGALEAAGRTVA